MHRPSTPARPAADTRFDFDSIERALADIRAGKAVLVVDDEDRENEGDLVFAASKATPGTAGVHDPAHLRRGLRPDARPETLTGSTCRR